MGLTEKSFLERWANMGINPTLTNGDAIRDMSDHSLAELFFKIQRDICDYKDQPPYYPTTIDEWVIWLNKKGGARA